MVKPVKTMTVTITELLKDNIKDIILIIYYKSFLHVHNLLPQLINSNPCGNEYFRNSFLPHIINEWKKLDPNIRSSGNYIVRNAFLTLLRPAERKIFNINDPLGIKC